MNEKNKILELSLAHSFATLEQVLEDYQPELRLEKVGAITFVGSGIVRVEGLKGVKADEVLRFPGNRLGLAFNLDVHETGVVLLDETEGLRAGSEVRRTGRVLDTPVGEALLGRVINPQGRPLDNAGEILLTERLPMERPAPGIMDRAPVKVPLQTGLKVIDALIPIGRGQRELILGDRQTGKTAIAVDTIINQKGRDVICIYCAIGKRATAVARVIATLREHQAMDYSIVVVARENDPPGVQFFSAYAAAAMGEYFMEQGRDVLVVFDDLTHHARAYREISLLLRRPPGREAFPGDVFYIHSRLLERFTHLSLELGGGSMTALPIVETEAQNISAYIPTNIISITDGQIYLEAGLFYAGQRPAVNVGLSVSRVGGNAQIKAMKQVAGRLRLDLAQYREMAAFAQFGTEMDASTRKQIDRGERMTELLKQPQYAPLSVEDQVMVLFSGVHGFLDDIPVADCRRFADEFLKWVRKNDKKLGAEIVQRGKIEEKTRVALDKALSEFKKSFKISNPEKEVSSAGSPGGREEKRIATKKKTKSITGL